MKPLHKGLLVATVQLALVASLGAKLLYDRATRPRGWARTAPYDPNLPIRGRYVRLQLEVQESAKLPDGQPVRLRVENQQLVAMPAEDDTGFYVRVRTVRGERVAVLDRPVAYFIPEKVADPSRRPGGEELWVEVTLPRKGPPRPIRLGVKKGDGPIVPLDLD